MFKTSLFLTNNDVKVEFVCTVPGLIDIEECQPKPSQKFTPNWWKSMPVSEKHTDSPWNAELTVKSCPSFPDFFSQGFIIPMWSDTLLKYDEESDRWSFRSGQTGSPFSWSAHPHSQFLNFVKDDVHHQGQRGTIVFKAISPWKLITPPGYSVYQLPLFYHFNNDFSVLPGIFPTDLNHEINQTVLYHGNGKEVFIERGQPFVHYIPFKRTKYTAEIRNQTKEDEKVFNYHYVDLSSKFSGAFLARKRRASREK